MANEAFVTAYLPAFFLIFARVSAAFFAMPVFNNRAIPVVAKISIAGAITFLLTPLQLSHLPAIDNGLAPYIFLIIQEIIVGLILGFLVTLVFNAFQMAGQMIGLQMGLNMASLISPLATGQTASYVDQFYTLLTALLFLAINGHHSVIIGFQSSFDILPLGTLVMSEGFQQTLSAAVSNTLVIAMRIALPTMAAMLLSDLAMLVVGRVMPQMNIFIVGMPLKLALGLAGFMVVLPAAAILIRSSFEGLPNQMFELLETLR